MDILTALDAIVDAAKDSKLSDEFYKKSAKYIKYVCGKLDITKEQCVFLSIFIEKSKDSKIYLSELADYLGCRTTHILRYSKEIDGLVERDYLRRARSGGRTFYHVTSDVLDAFKNNTPIPTRNVENLTMIDFFNRVAEIFDMVDDDEMESDSAEKRIDELIEYNKHLSFVEIVTVKYDIEGNDLLVLLIFCHLFITNNDDRIGVHDLEFMFSKWAIRHIKSELISGNSVLQEAKLIEWSSDGDFADREYYRLTMNAKRELLDELNLPSLSEKKVSRGVVKACDITPRNLFYSEEITHSIDELGKLLDEKNYQDIHSRLQEQGFRCGFTCLFYGEPGTGKTKTAMQLARRTDGILIATTNLAQNMDKAFERRFLYKIRFNKPTVEARVAIWREMLPALDMEDAKKLAEQYDFSGGQIENIARHYAIDAILHGNAVPTAENLASHCDSERINQSPSKKRIGFVNH